MREIKFRAWDKIDKELLTGDDGSGSYINDMFGYFDIREDETRYILMQFTGQKDYKKIEIYEGDIIQFTEVDEDSCMGAEETHIVSVEWISDISQWMCIFQSGRRIDLRCITNFGCIKECDVIGNIYENPELLTNK